MPIAKLIFLACCILTSPYWFWDALWIKPKKRRLLDQYAARGVSVRGVILTLPQDHDGGGGLALVCDSSHKHEVSVRYAYRAVMPPNNDHLSNDFCKERGDDENVNEGDEPIIVAKDYVTLPVPKSKRKRRQQQKRQEQKLRGIEIVMLPEYPHSGYPRTLIEKRITDYHGFVPVYGPAGIAFLCVLLGSWILEWILTSVLHNISPLLVYAMTLGLFLALGFPFAKCSYQRWEYKVLQAALPLSSSHLATTTRKKAAEGKQQLHSYELVHQEQVSLPERMLAFLLNDTDCINDEEAEGSDEDEDEEYGMELTSASLDGSSPDLVLAVGPVVSSPPRSPKSILL